MQTTNPWQRPLETPLPLTTPDAVPEATPAPIPTGIGGWLILPPFVLVFAIGVAGEHLAGLWEQFTQADGATRTALEFSLYAVLIYATALATLLHSFFHQERWVPRGFLVLAGIVAAWTLVAWFGGTLSGIQVGNLLVAFGWSAYFITSTRVKATFIQ